MCDDGFVVNCKGCQNFSKEAMICFETNDKLEICSEDDSHYFPSRQCPLSHVKEIYYKINPKGLNGYIGTIQDVIEEIRNHSEINEEWIIKPIEMTEYEYCHLSEFDGY